MNGLHRAWTTAPTPLRLEQIPIRRAISQLRSAPGRRHFKTQRRLDIALSPTAPALSLSAQAPRQSELRLQLARMLAQEPLSPWPLEIMLMLWAWHPAPSERERPRPVTARWRSVTTLSRRDPSQWLLAIRPQRRA